MKYKKDPFGLKGMQKQFEKNIKEMHTAGGVEPGTATCFGIGSGKGEKMTVLREN